MLLIKLIAGNIMTSLKRFKLNTLKAYTFSGCISEPISFLMAQ